MLNPSEIVMLWEILKNISTGNEEFFRSVNNVEFLHSPDYFFETFQLYEFEIGLPPINFLSHSSLQGIVANEIVKISAILPVWDLGGSKTDVSIEIEINRLSSSHFIIRGHDIL